jgi:predicted nucleic acid-binding protein
MIIVADSSPFVVLIAIGQIDVLASLFEEILIPPQVESELASTKRPEMVRAFIGAPPPWLRVQAPSVIEPIEGLHAGEIAAIALARELRADRLIMDESSGRRAAVERGLRVVGTIGVLEAAASCGLVELGQAFEAIKKTDFWVSPTFLDERLSLFLAQRATQAQDQADSSSG